MIDGEKYILSFPSGYTQPVLRVDLRSYRDTGYGYAFVDERGLDAAYDRASKAADIHQEGIDARDQSRVIAMERKHDLSMLGIDWTWNGEVL